MTALTLVSHELCPYVQRAAIALAEKDAPFERVWIDLTAKPDWFVALSPLGKVPLLRVATGTDETVLFESNVICEYIEETQDGPRLHPSDALQRAQHRAWIEFASAILSDLYGLETTQHSEVFEQKRGALGAKLARVEAALSRGPWFAGAAFSLVDAAYAPIFRYFELFDRLADLELWEGTPKLNRWREALASRASVRDATPPGYADRLHAFLVRHNAYLLRAGRRTV